MAKKERNPLSSNAFDKAYDTMMQTICERNLLSKDHACLLMVSGGSDSTALAYLMARLRQEEGVGALAMLHVNHMLRGPEADADAAFAERLAAALDIPFFCCQIDIAAEARMSGENVEATARKERYVAASEALSSMCEHEGFPLEKGRIVVAHSADDRIENFFMRAIVGTGPGGFRSMLYENGAVVRPLLDLARQDLRDAIQARQELGMPVISDAFGALWREDATNAHTDRFRAYVRMNLVPHAREWNENLTETLTRTMNLIADEDDYLAHLASLARNENVERLDGDLPMAQGFFLPPTFAEVPLPIARRVVHNCLKDMRGASARVDRACVDAILEAFADGAPKSGYVANIQGDIAVSSNKRGVRVEFMERFRQRRGRKLSR